MIITTEHADVLELQQRIASTTKHCLPVGARTKAALSGTPGADIQCISMERLTGIIAYEPSEYLITAYAGTKLSQIQAALAEFQQYLPFDPLFVEQGATLGGTVASGISGPNRMLYGGLRDFVMEVALIDGLGQLVRGGGRVVKNAAGFDLPKLVVGSYGRMGILTDVTLKVLPAPDAYATLTATYQSLAVLLHDMHKLLGQPLPISALNITPENQLQLRLSGPADCLPSVVARASSLLASKVEVVHDDQQLWRVASHFELATDELLLRITVQPDRLIPLQSAIAALDSGRLHSFACGGSIAWLFVDRNAHQQLQNFDRQLQSIASSGVAVAGPTEGLWVCGNRDWLNPARRIQRAMDPLGRFWVF